MMEAFLFFRLRCHGFWLTWDESLAGDEISVRIIYEEYAASSLTYNSCCHKMLR